MFHPAGMSEVRSAKYEVAEQKMCRLAGMWKKISLYIHLYTWILESLLMNTA
jgi:hypothetical protein